MRLFLPIAALARRLKEGDLRAGDIDGFPDVGARTALSVPLMSSAAPCSLPSPTDDNRERVLDSNELLVSNPEDTFAVRVSGESMIGTGLFPGDVAVVDVVVVPLAENPRIPNIEMSAETSLEIWAWSRPPCACRRPIRDARRQRRGNSASGG